MRMWYYRKWCYICFKVQLLSSDLKCCFTCSVSNTQHTWVDSNMMEHGSVQIKHSQLRWKRVFSFMLQPIYSQRESRACPLDGRRIVVVAAIIRSWLQTYASSCNQSGALDVTCIPFPLLHTGALVQCYKPASVLPFSYVRLGDS